MKKQILCCFVEKLLNLSKNESKVKWQLILIFEQKISINIFFKINTWSQIDNFNKEFISVLMNMNHKK